MEFKVTNHAADKFMDITGCPDRDRAKEKILIILRKSKKVKLHPAIVAQRILRNKFRNGNSIKPTEYYEFECYRMAVVDRVVITFELKFKERKRR